MVILYNYNTRMLWAQTRHKEGRCILIWGCNGGNLRSKRSWVGYDHTAIRIRQGDRVDVKLRNGYRIVSKDHPEYPALLEQVQQHLTWRALTISY